MGTEWTREGKESESEVTDLTIHERHYLYMHVERTKEEKQKKLKEINN
jgi:hypothetical protein